MSRLRASVLLAAVLLPAPLAAQRAPRSDTVAARAVFEANLAAINRRDRAAYLSDYLEAPTLAVNGPGGLALGYAPFAAQRDTTWPDTLVVTDLELVPLRPGVVYGQYRYRVTQHGVTTAGTSERVFVETPRGWKIAVTTAFPAPPGTPPAPLALVGATLVNPGAAPLSDAVVIAREGKIACAGTRAACPVPAGTDTLSVHSLWVIPGLIDAHVHFSQTGWVDGRPDALDLRARYPYDSVEAFLEAHPERYFRAYVCSGVTGVFDVGGYAWTWALRERAERDHLAPHVAAAGPLISTVDAPIINLPADRQILYAPTDSAARAAVRAFVAHGTDAIKVWYIVRPGADTTPLKAVVHAAGEEAHRLGARLIVHATGLWEAKDALRAGADVLVHSVFDRPVDSEFVALARERHVIYVPTLTVYDGYRQVLLRRFEPHYPLACVDTATRARARSTDTYPPPDLSPDTVAARVARRERDVRTAQANLATVFRAGITVAAGTDAGNPLTLHGPSLYWELEEMQRAGLTPAQVLETATRNGALAMGRTDLGVVAAGKAADLVVLGSDPTTDIAHVADVRYVMRGGALTIPRLAAPDGR